MDEKNTETSMEQKSGFYGGRSLLAMLGCLFVFLIISANGAVTPALNAMKEGLWADLPASTITLVNTLPNLSSILGCMVTGWVAGKYMSWKSFAILSLVLFIAFGIAPAALNVTDFYQTLVWRLLHGLACGMMWPLGNSLVMAMYEGSAQGNVLGWGQSIQSLGGVVMQLLGGYLATIQPQYCYFAYLLAVVGLLFAFGIPSLPKTKGKQASEQKQEKAKMSAMCWYGLALFFIGMCVVSPILMNNSTIMAQREFGDSFFSGIATSCYTGGGVVAGLVFGALFRKLKWNIVPIGYIGTAVGFFICIFATSSLMVCVAMAVTALCFVTVRPTLYEFLGHLVTPAQVATMLGYATAAFNLGSFVSTYYIKGCNVFFGGVEAPENSLWVSAIILIVMGVVTYFVNKKLSHKFTS